MVLEAEKSPTAISSKEEFEKSPIALSLGMQTSDLSINEKKKELKKVM